MSDELTDLQQLRITPGLVARWPKHDNRPQRGWWAPGEYLNRCHQCGQYFIGDKRALACADCAYKDCEVK